MSHSGGAAERNEIMSDMMNGFISMKAGLKAGMTKVKLRIEDGDHLAK